VCIGIYIHTHVYAFTCMSLCMRASFYIHTYVHKNSHLNENRLFNLSSNCLNHHTSPRDSNHPTVPDAPEHNMANTCPHPPRTAAGVLGVHLCGPSPCIPSWPVPVSSHCQGRGRSVGVYECGKDGRKGWHGVVGLNDEQISLNKSLYKQVEMIENGRTT
jgi:hypothetical protein